MLGGRRLPIVAARARAAALVSVGTLLFAHGAARAEEVVISLGFDVSVAPPQPDLVQGQDEVRFGAAIASRPDGVGAIFYGGQHGDPGPGSVPRADTWSFDGSTWEAVCGVDDLPPCAPGPRMLHAMATGPAGVVLYGGSPTGLGEGAGNAIRDDAWIFRDAGWELLCASCPPGPRAGAAAAGDGTRLLLFGGLGPSALPQNDTWSFDGEEWQRVDDGGPDAPAPRFGASLVWDGERFVLFGGGVFAAQDGSPVAMGDTWAWTGNGWEPICSESGDDPCGPSPRLLAGLAHLASADPARRGALLFGGLRFADDEGEPGGDGQEDGDDDGEEDDESPDLPSDAWFWNDGRWVELGTPWIGGPLGEETEFLPVLPFLPIFPAVASRSEACEVVFVASFPAPESSPFLMTQTWRIGFDADRDGAPDPCPPPPPPSRSVVALAYDDAMPPLAPELTAGGGHRFAPGFAATPDQAHALFYGGLFVGAAGTTTAQADTWSWDGAEWTPLCGTTIPGATGACSPGPRTMHAMATGPHGVLLYGGSAAAGPGFGFGGARDDLFRWTDDGWELVCDDCPPGPRIGAALAGNGDVVLLFGGVADGGQPLDDTWLFDGTSWQRLSAGGDGPSPRLAAQLAWDGASFVLFSGLGVSAEDPEDIAPVGADTWRWSFAEGRWLRECGDPDPPCGPSERAFASFTTLASGNPALRGVLLVGGFDFPGGDAALGDAWLWDGAGWLPLASPWDDRVYDIASITLPVPLGVAGASRTASCQATLTALVPETPGEVGTALLERTWNVGFDGDRDGVPDACPLPPLPTPTVAPPPPTATPTAAPAPSPTPSAAPEGRGRRISIRRGGTLPRSFAR